MKENLGKSSSEEDSSDDDEDDTSSKKTTKITRRLPLGVKLGTDKATGPFDIKPRLSIGERLMRQMELKSEKAKDDQQTAGNETDKPEVEETLETVDVDSTIQPETLKDNIQAETLDTDVTANIDTVPSQVESEINISDEAIEASEWGSEGEFGTDGEIDLSHNENAKAEVPNEPAETFAEIPSTLVEEIAEDESSVEPELLESGIGEELPPEPPDSALESEPVVPERPLPASGTPERPWYDAVAHDRLMREHKEELHDVEYQAEKRGLRHGVGAGLFAGWLFGRRGKKKLIKEHTNELKTKNNEIKDLKNEQFAAKQRIDEIKRTQEHIRKNIEQEAKKPALKSTPEVIPTFVPGKSSEVTRSNNKVSNQSERSANITPNIAPEILSAATESLILPAELVAVSAATREKQPNLSERKKSPEQSPIEHEITEEMYVTDKGRHIETSAWHRIEIDEKTGKPVENPKVAYGEEFKRERRREILPEDYKGGSNNGSASVLGGLAASATAGSALISIATKQDQGGIQNVETAPIDLPEKHPHLTDGNNLLRYASKPLTWAVAVVIVAFLFLVGIIH